MRRIQKIIQQRRRQLHVHLPPSELMGVNCDDGPSGAKPMPQREVNLARMRRATFEGSAGD